LSQIFIKLKNITGQITHCNKKHIYVPDIYTLCDALADNEIYPIKVRKETGFAVLSWLDFIGSEAA